VVRVESLIFFVNFHPFHATASHSSLSINHYQQSLITVAASAPAQAASPSAFFGRKIFLNTSGPQAVFMFEGKRVVAGEAVLSGAASIERSQNEMLESLVREHSRLVYRIAYAVLRSHHDAEDATQETFLRVFRCSTKLSGVENHKAWLARVAWRVATDRRRPGPMKEVSIDDEDKPIDVASTESIADAALVEAQLGSVLDKLIDALPEKLRQPLVLSAIQEMAPREVAAVLGINEAAVRSRVFRARQILKEKLAQCMGGKR
jgi:RNA polymerase sigma-70 factor (ECF subfamily)